MLNFYYGEHNEAVKKVQQLLRNIGFHIKTDGIYGSETENALKQFQEDHSLKQDEVLHKLYLLNGYSASLAYINSRDIPSSTDYLIWGDNPSHTVYVYKGRTHLWQEVLTSPAAFGKPETPTVKGIFFVGVKGLGYGGPKYGFKVKWYTQFYHNYLFHSILYNLDGTVFDGRLGEDLSDGCIRLPPDVAKYIYDEVPSSSTVLIT